MKTITHLPRNIRKLVLFVLVAAAGVTAKAQGLKFENSVIESGSPGANNTVYRFPLVNSNMDALVKIVGRSSALVTLVSIDITNTGWQKAWQPSISYNNGNVNGAQDWWMEFQFDFVNKTTSTPATVTTFDLTALDIDGNGSRLSEWNSFYGASSFVLAGVSQLTVSNILGTLLDLLRPGKKFVGPLTNYPGIDTTVTSIMTTITYNNANTFTMRIGGTSSGTTSGTTRMSSVWFKSFQYTSPQTLPISLSYFTATLNNNKADLRWATSAEINVSHFAIEKSFDGKTYEDAGIVFAMGKTIDKTNYSFSDAVNTDKAGVIYYRLRSVDIDGKNQYSDTRVIRTGQQSKKGISILTYPNPVTTDLRVTIPATWQNKKVVYEIYRGNGQSASRLQRNNSNQTESLNLNVLAPGFYMIRVTCEGETAQQKIIKQ
jgi:hypothetical protein